MPETYIKKYKPAPFVPTTSFSGAETNLVLRGQNMWLKFGRFGTVYAEGYSGSRNLSETIPTKTLTGTLAWSTSTKDVIGTGTAFLDELHLGSFVLGDGGAGASELFVVEKIVSNTLFVASRLPTATQSGKTGYVMPVVFPVGTDRGTLIRGNAIQFPKGHYLAVGDGELKINGTSLSASLTASRTPRFALYDASAGTYTQDDVGIAQPLVPVTLTAVATGNQTVSGATNASPIVITTAAAHRLYTGQQVNISGVTGNTAANGDWTVTKLTDTTFSLNNSSGNGGYAGGGTVNSPQSPMRAGGYNIRICAYRSGTTGYSNPSDAIAPVTLTAGQQIRITFNEAMPPDRDGYLIFGTPFEDNSSTTVEARYMGAWFLVKTITAENLKDTAHPTGRESGTTFDFFYADAEIQTADQILSFNNFAPVDAEFVDLINGIPLYFSCLGKGTTAKTEGTSPGAACVPSKPSNPEAVLLKKRFTTAGGDTIIGEFNAKSRIFVLCQNTLQVVILTTIDEEPIAFRSLWNAGFRNPYNVAFVKEYLYGFSTQKIVRSVAGGDDSTVEFEFASDVSDYIVDWETGHVLTAYDPKNRAVCFFYAAAERDSNGYWVTICLPFLLDKQVWNPPIVLKKTDQDFIVSGVATIGKDLVMTAGGRTSGGSITVGTYIFDGGDSEIKEWYLAWAFADDDRELNAKTIKGVTLNGLFPSETFIKLYGMNIEGAFDIDGLASGQNATVTFEAVAASVARSRRKFEFADTIPFSLYAPRLEGTYMSIVPILDEIVFKVEVNNSEA